jgi:hypothetical protein
VAKLSPDGRTLLYSTYLSAIGPTYGLDPSMPAALAVDANGNAFVTGTTTGLHFPQIGVVSPGSGGGNDAFVIKLDTNGNLVASQLFGGSGDDAGTSIALGPDGGLYVAGTTASVNFPTSMGAYRTTGSGSQEMFLMKLDPSYLVGSQLYARAVLYSTYLGPGASPFAGGDSLGNAYVAASTTSAAWSASSGAVQPHCAGSACADAIVVKVNPTARWHALIHPLYCRHPVFFPPDHAGGPLGSVMDASGSLAKGSWAARFFDSHDEFSSGSGRSYPQILPRTQFSQPDQSNAGSKLLGSILTDRRA